MRWYRVAFAGGVDLRHGPSVEAPRTGETLLGATEGVRRDWDPNSKISELGVEEGWENLILAS